jgi:hypothetical protein
MDKINYNGFWATANSAGVNYMHTSPLGTSTSVHMLPSNIDIVWSSASANLKVLIIYVWLLSKICGQNQRSPMDGLGIKLNLLDWE